MEMKITVVLNTKGEPDPKAGVVVEIDGVTLTVSSPVAALSATRWLEKLSVEVREAKRTSDINRDPADAPLAIPKQRIP